VPKRQVLEDEISADLEGRAERSRKSGEDLEHQPSLPAITAGCQRLPWADGVLANHKFWPGLFEAMLEGWVTDEEC